MDLNIEEEAEVRAAWLSFPNFNLEPLNQLYQRIGYDTYHYESSNGAFKSELQVNESGFITYYPKLWRKEG